MTFYGLPMLSDDVRESWLVTELMSSEDAPGGFQPGPYSGDDLLDSPVGKGSENATQLP
jgi:hypothetical protein